MKRLFILLVSIMALSGCDNHSKPNDEVSGKWIMTYINVNYGTVIRRVDVNSIERNGNIVKVWRDTKFETLERHVFYNQIREEFDCKYKVRRPIYQLAHDDGVLNKEYSGPNELLSKEGKASYQWEKVNSYLSEEYKIVCKE